MTSNDLLEVEARDGVTVVRFTRRTILDPDSVERVAACLLELIRDKGARKVVLDFERVESLTSAMLGKLAFLHSEVEAAGGRLVFCNVGAFLREIFTLCGLPAQIPLVSDEPAALAAFV